MNGPIAVIGAPGQLGSDLMKVWPIDQPGSELCGLGHGQIEVSNRESVESVLSGISPKIVVNTSAFHRVEEIEIDPARAFAVNAIGAKNLAVACAKIDAVLIHISTDYVFSGRKGAAYIEQDSVDPVNMYGISKAAGEMAIRCLCPKHFIVRTSGLYGTAGPSGKGSNFVELMLNLARRERSIRVVDDQILTPTPTKYLAKQIARLALRSEYGTYHATSQGECSWYEFAKTIFEISDLSPSLSPQSTQMSGSIAARPTYSVLENKKLMTLGIDEMPAWREGLKEYLEERSSLKSGSSFDN